MKNRYVCMVSASFLLLLVGCGKDYLDTKPTKQVTEDVAFGSVNSLNATINGVYRFMFQRTDVVTANQQNKPGVAGILLGLDFMGEDLGIASSTWFTSTGEGNWVAARTDNHNVNEYYYRTFYKIIGDANKVLINLDKVVASEDEKKKIKVQALTLRAYAYSNLIQLYAKRYDKALGNNNQLGVPLVLTVEETPLPRATVQEVYNSIISDLDQAIELNVMTRENKSQINSLVSKGLRARVALTMQDYDKAIQYAKEVIDNGTFPLMSINDYTNGFNDATIGEYMWALMPTVDQDDTFGSYFAQIAYNANTTFMRGNPKRINSLLYDKIPSTDVRKKMWEPKPTADNFPLPTSAFNRQPYMSRKFSVKISNTSLGDVSLMRSAEMYLILAEAYATNGNDNMAQEALFELNTSRDLSAVKSNMIGAELLNEIWETRRYELWGEGFRYLDLKRLNQPLNRTIVPNYVIASVNDLTEVPAGDVRWQFLFPRAELNANPKIVQND